MKKLISLMLTLAMVLSLGITALALGPGESLIIRYEGTLEEFDLIAVFWEEGSEWNTASEYCKLMDEAEKLYWCIIPEGTDAVSLAVSYPNEAGEWDTGYYPGTKTFEEIGSGRLVAPADLSDDIYVENSSSSTNQSIEVTGTYVPGGGDTETTVSIDLEWGNMNFIYTAGTQVWNPETHEYEYQEGSWAPEEENNNFIVVTNHSDVAVEASLDFKAKGYTGAFMDEAQREVIENLSLDRATEEAEAPRAISYFFITGGTMDEYSDKQLGYINITILAEEGDNSGGTANRDVATYAPDTESAQRYWQDEGNLLRVGINKNYVDVSKMDPNGNEDADDAFKIDLNGAKIGDEEIKDGYTPMHIMRNEGSENYIGVSHCVNDKTDIWIYPFGNEIGVETYVLEYSLDEFVFEKGYTYLDTDEFVEGTVTKAGIRIEITISYEDYASAAIYDPATQDGVFPAMKPTVIDASADGIEVTGTTADGTQFEGRADAYYRVLLDGATVSDPTPQLMQLTEMSFIVYQTSADNPHEIDVYFCLEQGDLDLAEIIENYADAYGVLYLPGITHPGVTYPAEYISLEGDHTLEKYENNSTYDSMGGLSDRGLNFLWPFSVKNYQAE